MNSQTKSRSKKILKSLLIVLVILSTILTIKAFAKYIVEKRSTNQRSISEFEAWDTGHHKYYYVWWELKDLDENWFIICCQHNTAVLPSGNYTVSATCNGCGATLTIDTQKAIHEASCVGEKWTGCTHCKSGSYTINGDDWSRTMGYYSLSFPDSIENYKCGPAEAYILAESMYNYPGNHLNSEVQKAFWNTWVGHAHMGGQPGEDNGLWQEAKAFQDYICTLLDIPDPGHENPFPSGHHITTDWAWEGLDGAGEEIKEQEGTVDAGFDIKYEPIWYNVDGDEEEDPRYKSEPDKYKDVDHDGQITEADKVTYSVEPNAESSTGSYLVVGPYSIEYLERNITARSETVHFSKITKMSILTNLGYSTIVGEGEDKNNRKDESDPPVDDNPVKWKMRFVDGTGNRTAGDDYEFPHCDEVFYLLIEYTPELTVLNGIDVEFRYMNASAIIDVYDGYWNKYYWDTWSAVCCWWPTIPPTPKDYKGGMYLKEVEEKIDSQGLVWMDEAVRWYNYTDLSRNDGTPLIANITIEKELVDEAGNRINVDGEYSFNIYVDYQDGEGEQLFETLTVLVENGYGKKVSQNITWEGEGFALVGGRDEGISKENGYDPISPVVGKTPTYRVEEIVPEGSTQVSIEPTEGTLQPFNTVKIYAKNTLEPHKGKIKVKKEFTNILHDLQKQYMEGQTYYFKVEVTGQYQCPTQAAEEGKDPSTFYTNLVWLITIDASDNWEVELPEVIWYDETNPPTYKVDELYPDKVPIIIEQEYKKQGIPQGDIDATINGLFPGGVPEYYYKLSSISNASGVIIEAPEDDPEVVRTVIATNEPTLKVTTLQLNKEILDELKPESGDEFKVHLKIEIKDDGFDINGLNGKAFNKDNPYEQEITLNSGNDWTSEKITVIWYGKVAPSYTVKEIEYPNKYTFGSIRDGLKSTTKGEFTNKLTNKLQEIKITIVNKLRETESGTISVIKRTETDELNGQSFGFTVEVEGKFKYIADDGSVQEYDTSLDSSSKFTFAGSVVTGGDAVKINGKFVWYAGEEKPTYTVTENDLTDSQIEEGIEFVSISNDNKTVTNRQSITDSFSGEKEEPVVIRILNNKKGPSNKTGKIRIDKITVGNLEYLQYVNDEDLVFKFEVSLSSKDTFIYNAPDGTNTRVVNDEVKLSNTGWHGSDSIYVTLTVDRATGKTETWTSGEITWDENSVAPTFSVREVDIPEWAKFRSWRTTTSTVGTTKIIGNVLEGITANTLTAINQIVEKYQYGSLRILKKAATINITGQEFLFTLTVKGHFWYDGTEYKPTDDPLVIENISVNADDENGWTSGTFRWLYSDKAPSYTVVENLGDDEEPEEGEVPTTPADPETEEDPYEGVEIISISNGLQSNSDNSISGSLVGRDTEDGGDTGKGVVTVTAINKKEPKQVSGYIQLEKKLILDGNEFDSDRRFTFMVTLTYHDKILDSSGNVNVTDRVVKIPVSIKAGQKSRVVRATWWDYEDAPDYEIEEIGDDDISVNWSEGSPSGKLIENDVVYLTAENTFNGPHQGKLSIEKKIEYNNKLSADDIKNLTEKFTFNVYVTGTFTYKVGDSIRFYDNTTMQLKVELNMAENATWTSEGEFTWYGDDVPSYAIEEVNLPNGIYLKSIENASGKLSEGTTKAVCTNKIELREVVLLTMELAGRVWDDTDYNAGKDADTQENGLIDEGEPGMEGIRVRVYRVVTNEVGNIVDVLDGVYMCPDNNVLAGAQKTSEKYAETFTDSFGNWSFGTLSVPGFDDKDQAASYSGYTVSYDVRFDYDGQTYEPTTFLATTLGGNGGPAGNPQTYINSSTSERDKYLNDSMASDQNHVLSNNSGLYDGVEDRDTFNNKFATIEGQEPIDENGKTLGKTDGGIELHYSSTDSSSFVGGNNTRKISILDLYNEDGELYEDYLITATTSTGALTYPFDKNIHLASWDKKVMWFGIQTEYVYSATYNYMQHINLGLIKREAADLAVEKDLTEAVVVVNGKVLKYKYNSSIDLDDPDNLDLLYKQIQVADEQFEYKLGLYSSDYYYRASIYGGSDAEGPMNSFYCGTMGYSSLKDLEMEVYLKYTINVYNESDTYTAEVKELADYHDDTLSLVTSSAETARYVKTLNGVEVNDKIELAEEPQMTIYGVRPEAEDGELGEAPIKVDKTSISWSDDVETVEDERNGVSFIKMTTTGLSGQKLESGERAELTVTFKINKADSIGENNLIEDEIELGEKHNVVEITKFSSYYSESSKNKWQHAIGEVTGRVDEDSAPDNVNIQMFNEKNWYEDDTDSAPSIEVYLYNVQRNINGAVWEDAQTNKIKYNQIIGDGVYNPDQGDRNVPNMTTELVETILIPNNTGPGATYTEYDFIWPTDEPLLSGKTVEEVTGFDSTIVTDNGGNYEFTAVPAGNYKVRFVYGDKDIRTGNTIDEVYYNGQDYKSTAYQVGYDNDSDDDYYVDNEWHDLTNNKLTAERVSDARDSEARRLWITTKSEMLSYDNTNILATADELHTEDEEQAIKEAIEGGADVEDADELHKELYGSYNKAKDDGSVVTGSGYYMYAETAKLNIEVENVYKINYTTETIEGKTEEEAGDDKLIYTLDGDIEKGAVKLGNTFVYDINNIDFGLEERSQTKLTLDKQIKEIKLTTPDDKVILDAIYDIYYDLGEDDNIKALVTLSQVYSTNYNQIASLNRTKSSQGYRYIMAESTILQGTTITITYQLSVFNVGEADTCNVILKDLWTEINKDLTIESIEKLLEDTKTMFDSGSGGGSGSAGKLSEILTELTSPYYTEEKGRLTFDQSDKYEYGKYFGNIYYQGTQGTYITDEEISANGRLSEDDKIMLVETTVHQMIDYVDPDVEFRDTDNIEIDKSWSTTTIQYLIDNELISPEAVIIVNNDTGIPETQTDSEGQLKPVTYADRAINEASEHYAFVNDEIKEFITYDDEGNITKNNVILSVDQGADPENPDAEPEAGTNPGLVRELIPFTASVEKILERKEAEGVEVSETKEAVEIMDEAKKSSTAAITLDISRYYASEEDGEDVDNLAEIIKYENTVGRRDIRAIAGNASTYELEKDAPDYTYTVGLYQIAGKEPDTSATEVVTLTPPTGLDSGTKLIAQIVITALISGIVLIAGIVLIKKKVLKNKI